MSEEKMGANLFHQTRGGAVPAVLSLYHLCVSMCIAFTALLIAIIVVVDGEDDRQLWRQGHDSYTVININIVMCL